MCLLLVQKIYVPVVSGQKICVCCSWTEDISILLMYRIYVSVVSIQKICVCC